MSKVSPGIGWWHSGGSGISTTSAHGSMVVNATNPHRRRPGSNPRRILPISILSQRN